MMDTSEPHGAAVHEQEIQPVRVIAGPEETNEPITPQATEESVEELEIVDTNDERVGYRRPVMIAAAGAAVIALLGGGIYLGANISRPRGNGAPDPDAKDRQIATPLASAPALPQITPEATPVAPTPTEVPGESETVTIKEISANLSPDEIGEAVLQEAWVDWRNTGIGSNAAQLQKASGLGIPDFAQEQSRQTTDKYTDTLFIKDWQNDSDNAAFVKQVSSDNAASIGLSVLTDGKSFPFEWKSDVESVEVVNQTSNQMNLLISFTDYNNASQFGESVSYPELIKESGVHSQIAVRVFKDSNSDTVKIANIQKYSVE